MRAQSHPSERALADFIAGELPPAAARKVVRHLLAGCVDCKRVTSQLWPPATTSRTGARPVPRVSLDRLRRREEGMRAEREQTDRLLAELDQHPPNRRLLLVINSQRFHTWFLAERLVDRAFDLGFKDPAQAVAWAELAVALSDRLPNERYGVGLVNDIRGRAWAALGNARRIASDPAGAGEAFQRAEALLENGTGDPLEQVRLLSFRGRYLMTRRDLRESVRLYDRVVRICRQIGDEHEMGRALIDKATTLATAGDYAGAIRATEEGLRHIDAESAPRVALAAKHNLSLFLHRNGDFDRAMSLLQEILPLYAKQNDEMVLLRLRWLEGRLAQAQRQFGRAEEAFREVRRSFLDHDIPFEAASVSFDLATVLLEQQRYGELEALAAELVTVFRSFGIARETIAALEFFQEAIQLQRLSVSWIAELTDYFERAQAKPGLRFRPSS